MSTILTLSEKEIRSRVGEQSFQRGQQYFRSGAIFEARRQGITLKARCEGSRAEAYRLHVTFDAQGITEADCSCPVGDGGHCKHVAALLLTWRERPEAFTEIEELDTALERRSKAELIALIKQMLRQQPDLELLLETPLPTSGKRHMPVSPETYRRQAEAAFRRGGHDWDAEAGVADELLAIKEIGDGFAQQHDYASAAVVYEAVSAEVLDHYEMFPDEGGDLGGVVNECVEGLGNCLAGERDNSATREAILRALFAIYRFDIDYGGVSLGDALDVLQLECRFLSHSSSRANAAIRSCKRLASVLSNTTPTKNPLHRPRRVYLVAAPFLRVLYELRTS